MCGFCNGGSVVVDEPLSPHFLLSELLVSETAARRGLANDPSPECIENLRRLSNDLLEPIRSRFGAIHVNSGHRSDAVNSAIGGSTSSAHVPGNAADIIPLLPGITLKQIVDWVIASDLPYDQIIFEGSWVHVARIGPGGSVRKQALQMFGGSYSPYDPSDPRVQGQ